MKEISVHRLSAVVEHSPQLVLLVDENGTKLYLNKRARFERKQGSRLMRFIREQVLGELWEDTLAVVEETGLWRRVFTIQVSESTSTQVLVSVLPFKGDILVEDEYIITITRQGQHKSDRFVGEEIIESLRETSLILGSTMKSFDIERRFLRIIASLIANNRAVYYRVEDNQAIVSQLVTRDEDPFSEEPLPDIPDIRKYQPIFQMLHLNQPLLISDTSVLTDEVLWSEWARSILAYPVRTEERVFGFIMMESASVSEYSGFHADRLMIFCNQAAVAINNSLLYHELENYSGILEEAVQETSARFWRTKERVETILNNSPDAIVLLKAEGTIDATNPAYVELFDYQFDESYGEYPGFLVIEEGREIFELYLKDVLSEGVSRRMETIALRRDGSSFDADVIIAPIKEAEGLLGAVVSIRDISKLKEVERMKDGFLSTAAHELRTPLTSIQGFSEILLMRDLDAERRQRYIGYINEQAEQLGRVVNDLLDISRLEAGRGLDLNPEPLNIQTLIDETVHPYTEGNPAHRFITSYESALPEIVGDPFRLTQVLHNLLSNAIKYSPDGGDVTIKALRKGDFIQVSISDQGVGIKKDDQEHLYEKFYRVKQDSFIIGAGLGLSICKLVVDLHGGDVFVESSYGDGSTFGFTLPIIRDEEPQEGES